MPNIYCQIFILTNIFPKQNREYSWMWKDKQLLERQSMERNLQRLLREVQYKSCGSDTVDDGQQNPVNPFMKRVFQKKLRRSSVASENINPNSSIMRTQQNQDSSMVKVKTIIERGNNLLKKLQNSILSQMQQIDKTNESKKSSNRSKSMVLTNLQTTIQQIQSIILSQHKLPSQALNPRSSITLIEHYQCPSSPSVTPATVHKQQSTKRSRTKKQGKQNRQKNYINNAQVLIPRSTQNYHSKSVYQSVLEERRTKKTKNSRIV